MFRPTIKWQNYELSFVISEHKYICLSCQKPNTDSLFVFRFILNFHIEVDRKIYRKDWKTTFLQLFAKFLKRLKVYIRYFVKIFLLLVLLNLSHGLRHELVLLIVPYDCFQWEAIKVLKIHQHLSQRNSMSYMSQKIVFMQIWLILARTPEDRKFGGGGGRHSNIHLCKLYKQSISKDINLAENEYMNICLPNYRSSGALEFWHERGTRNS